MKIRTIVGVLLVLALVLGSTGAALAAEGDGDGPIQDRLQDGDKLQDRDILQDRDRLQDGTCQNNPNGNE